MTKRRVRINSSARLLAVLLLIGGCTVGPQYRPPDMPLPGSFGAAASALSVSSNVASWWTEFQDPTLDSLIARALDGNPDLQQSVSRIRQAREQERIASGASGPKLNASTQAGYTRLSANALPSALTNLGGLNNGASSTSSGIGLPGDAFTNYQLGFDASWELDLLGGQRRTEEAARARTESFVWSERDLAVALVAEVANNYQQYRSLQRRLATADESLAAERELLEHTRVRASHGLTTSVDEQHRRQSMEQFAALRSDLAAQADMRLHALSMLLGLSPTALGSELSELPGSGPAVFDVPPGLPSELLQRRPDIRAAERRLAAATADVGVATAALYPKLSITGALQLASRSLTSLLESDAVQANGAGRLSLPLLDRGSRRATVRLRNAQADEAALAYQRQVLTALREVADALTRLDADERRTAHFRAALLAAEDAADTSRVRHRNGLSDLVDVWQARVRELSARDVLLQAEAATAQDRVALYKALGGGWDERRHQDQSGANE